jgi:hypothetical protein
MKVRLSGRDREKFQCSGKGASFDGLATSTRTMSPSISTGNVGTGRIAGREEGAPVRARKAVIPAAGLGTRFLPATKAQPKEMLPVVDKPAIQYVVEEAVTAGLDDVLRRIRLIDGVLSSETNLYLTTKRATRRPYRADQME